MLEFTLDDAAAAPITDGITVIGIGGAGANVIDSLALDTLEGVEILTMNCDVRALNSSMAPRKIQLGRNLTQGLGCGGDPELGLEAAVSSSDEIRSVLNGRRMVFICTGLGGGTGSGAAPMIARLAREAGAFVVIFATMPFVFEGKRRMKQADAALTELRRHANALVTFENDRMGELVLPKKGITEAFEVADRVIGQSIRAVTGIVNRRGLIRIGMDDLMTALRNADSRCLFGFGQAKGESRAVDALEQALKSPLLDRGQMLEKAGNVLVHVCGGPSMTLFEIETLMRELNKHINDDAHILFGAATDAALGDAMSVTVITSLSRPLPTPVAPAGQEEQPAAVAQPAVPSLIAAALSSRTQPVAILPVAPRVLPPNAAAPVSTTVTTATTTVPTLKLDARLLNDLATPIQITRPQPPATLHPCPFQVNEPVQEAAPVAPAPAPEPIVEAKKVEPDLFGEAAARRPAPAKARTRAAAAKVVEAIAPVAAVAAAPTPEPVYVQPEMVAPPAPEPPVPAAFVEEELEEEVINEILPEEEEDEGVWAEEEEIPVSAAPAVEEELEEGDFEEEEEEVVSEVEAVEEDVVEEEEEEVELEPEPPARVVRKFDLKDILVQRQQTAGYLNQTPAQSNGNGHAPVSEPVRPAPQRPAARPEPAVAVTRPVPVQAPAPVRPAALRPVPVAAARPAVVPTQQQTFDERLERTAVGRFEKGQPTVEEGEDLDVPTFLRRKR